MSAPTTKTNWINQELVVPHDLALKLQAEAQRSPAFEALCQLLSVRERTRKMITVRTMQASLRNEGFEFTKGDVSRCFRQLAAFGVGRLVTTDKDQVEGLTEIKYSLHSISEASLSKRPGPKLMTIDDVPPSKLAKVTPAKPPVDHLASAKGSPLNANPRPSTTLEAPLSFAAQRRLSTQSAQVEPDEGVVTIRHGKNSYEFTVTAEVAKNLIKQLI